FGQASDGRVLVRRGARNQALFGEELFLFLSERSIERFDTSDSGTSLNTASDALVQVMADAFGWTDPELHIERLVGHGLALRSGHELRLTIRGSLYLL